MECAAQNQNFVFRLLRPASVTQARSQAQAWQSDAGSMKPAQGRVLLLAGALSYPFRMLLIKALDGDRMLDTVVKEYIQTWLRVVVREWTPQACGIMIQLLPENFSWESIGDKGSLPSQSILHRVYTALHSGNSFPGVMGSINRWYLTSTTKEKSAGTEYTAVNLDTDAVECFSSGTVSPLSKALVYCFAPDGDRVRCWSSAAMVEVDLVVPAASSSKPDYGDGGDLNLR